MPAPAYFTVKAPRQMEIKVKDSRFIAHLAPATTREAAEAFIARIVAEHPSATHNCSAYRIGAGDSAIFRSDDAGEPAGSAGKPILQALETRNIADAVLVVTRYFGGTKLGIGGLIRAYGAAAFAAIDQAVLLEKRPVAHLTIRFAYSHTGAVQAVLHRFSVQITDSEYGAEPAITVALDEAEQEAFVKALLDATRGEAVIRQHKLR